MFFENLIDFRSIASIHFVIGLQIVKQINNNQMKKEDDVKMAKVKAKKIIGIYGWEVYGIIRYVGHAHDIKNSRQHNHISKMRYGKHTKKMQAFWNEINDESAWKLVVLEECSVHDLLVRESYWKDLHKDTIKNTNKIKNLKKTFRTGLNSKRHKEQFRELFSGEKNPNYQEGNIDIVIAIKYLLEKGIKNKEICKIFDCNPEYVSRIKTKKRWKDVVVPEDYVFTYELKLEQKNEIETAETISTSEENILCEGIIS